MTEAIKKLVVNLETGVQQYIDLTAEELEQRELDAIAFATAEAERVAQAEALETLKASARSKLIAGQPLTEEEAAVLVI